LVAFEDSPPYIPPHVKNMKSAYLKTTATILIPLGLWTLLLLIVPYSAAFSLLLKVALWGIPAYFFPKLVDRTNPNEFLLLNRAPQIKWIALSVIFLVAYSLLTNGGKIEVKSFSVFYFVSAIVLSPIIEEVAFRGVVLQKLDQLGGFRIANVATAVLFTLYHIPLWAARGQGISMLACLWVIFFSLCLGYFLFQSKSLWTCTIIHAVQNLLFRVL
jgi:membrane protease YdiL (CAAX protease family)